MEFDKVTQVFGDYAWAMDAKDFDLLNQVFTEDATFVVSIAGGDTVGPFEGRAAAVEFITTTTREQTDQRRHVITNIRQDGASAATATLTLVVVDNGQLTVKSSGVYRVQLAEEGGTPRFSRMDLALDLGF